MLEYLRIRNLALIEDMELEFGPGMNALTGETGAGKSFILKALGFLLGDRLQPDMVRAGADRASVEAVFSCVGEEGKEILLKRELLSSGRSRIYLNDEVKTQETIRRMRDTLIAFTSQHGQQKLLQPAWQDELMEKTVDCPELLAERDSLLAKLHEKHEERLAIEAKRAKIAEVRDLLEMQQQEIDKVDPEEDEDIRLEELRVRARRYEEAAKDYKTAHDMLYGYGSDGPGLMDMLGEFQRLIERMGKDDKELETSIQALSALSQELQAIAPHLRRPPVMEDMPEDMNEVEQRLYTLSQLKRRLRRTLPEILSLKDEIEEKISFLDSCTLDINRLKREEAALIKRLGEVVGEIIPKRRASCEKFARRLEEQLSGLGFSEEVRVIPDFVAKPLCPGVNDEKVRIQWAPNPGQAPQPLDRIASGGELSRFLLALVCVMPTAESATFIFDEVDSGVGGLTLNSLADRLELLASTHQMLLITHWPQIAVRAGWHFHISKVIRNGMTFTQCEPLTEKQRHAEIVRMAGGGAQGEALACALTDGGPAADGEN